MKTQAAAIDGEPTITLTMTVSCAWRIADALVGNARARRKEYDQILRRTHPDNTPPRYDDLIKAIVDSVREEQPKYAEQFSEQFTAKP